MHEMGTVPAIPALRRPRHLQRLRNMTCTMLTQLVTAAQFSEASRELDGLMECLCGADNCRGVTL